MRLKELDNSVNGSCGTGKRNRNYCPQYQPLENGETDMLLGTAIQLAKFFEVSLDKFVE